TLFSKSATSFFTQKPPPLSQTPHQPNSATKGYVSVSEPASIRRWLTKMQAPSDKKSHFTSDARCVADGFSFAPELGGSFWMVLVGGRVGQPSP
ncbi:MAG: hypothetical protein KBC94_23675, partial [Pseudacidovorax sp.]|uniref:hypothetical protein n=1 Tax=Pseudacidovorax sp. TaxID=1934311 RepID=UPI001B4056C6